MHGKAIKQVKNAFSDCKCVDHCNIGHVQPDLTCVCSDEPLTIVEVETPDSLERSHTKKQIFLMSKRAEESNDQYAVVVADGVKMCGIPLNTEGKQLLRERKIPFCSKQKYS